MAGILVAIAFFAFLGAFCGRGWAMLVASVRKRAVSSMSGAVASAICTYVLIWCAALQNGGSPVQWIALTSAALSAVFGFFLAKQ